ncbi:hypothetical protein BN7874_012 [Phage NCTB]|nr:hypothetical protein BN7874_012 [Phage NCTB]
MVYIKGKFQCVKINGSKHIKNGHKFRVARIFFKGTDISKKHVNSGTDARPKRRTLMTPH